MVKDDVTPSKQLKSAKHIGERGAVKSELRGRELVYVDVDDDVTSIVGKIKSAKEAVVALVPPKRIGTLQSVVNLKLLQRAAKNEKKHLVIVTTDPALSNLASGLTIPIAKNINAQAKIPDMSEDDDVSNVIDGGDISVGDLDRRARGKRKDDSDDISAAVTAIETDDKIHNDLNADGINDDEEQNEPRGKVNKQPVKKSKIPDVNSFHKKLVVGIVAAVVLVVFGVWAFVFAPTATITIKAKTSSQSVEKSLSLIPSTDTDVERGILAPVIKQKKTNESVQFEATGSKETGEPAKGSIEVCNKAKVYVDDNDNKITPSESFAAGTRVYANGVQYTLDAPIEVQGSNKNTGSSCEVVTTVKVTAVNIGEDGNIAADTVMTIAGASDSIKAKAKSDFTGGSKQTVKIVQQADVDAAVEKLKNQIGGDSVKNELEGQMSDSTVVIDSSFTTNQGAVKVSPNVGETPNGQASVSAEITYTLVGINKDNLNSVLDTQLKNSADSSSQKIYDNGLKSVEFSDFASARSGYTVTIKAKAHVGPVIDDNEVKKSAAGKKAEEIKAQIKQTAGVSDVDVQMSPFWVSSAPSADKIKVNFTIDE